MESPVSDAPLLGGLTAEEVVQGVTQGHVYVEGGCFQSVLKQNDLTEQNKGKGINLQIPLLQSPLLT